MGDSYLFRQGAAMAARHQHASWRTKTIGGSSSSAATSSSQTPSTTSPLGRILLCPPVAGAGIDGVHHDQDAHVGSGSATVVVAASSTTSTPSPGGTVAVAASNVHCTIPPVCGRIPPFPLAAGAEREGVTGASSVPPAGQAMVAASSTSSSRRAPTHETPSIVSGAVPPARPAHYWPRPLMAGVSESYPTAAPLLGGCEESAVDASQKRGPTFILTRRPKTPLLRSHGTHLAPGEGSAAAFQQLLPLW